MWEGTVDAMKMKEKKLLICCSDDDTMGTRQFRYRIY